MLKTMVNPFTKKITKLVYSKDANLQITQIPLSGDKINGWMKHVLEDICRGVMKQMKGKHQKFVYSCLNQLMFQIALNFLCLVDICIRIT